MHKPTELGRFDIDHFLTACFCSCRDLAARNCMVNADFIVKIGGETLYNDCYLSIVALGIVFEF